MRGGERFALPDGELDLRSAVVRRGGTDVPLTRLEHHLLRYLAERRGEIVPKAEVENAVWAYAPGVDSEAVPVAIRRLRKKLERDPTAPEVLLTVYGIGWRLDLGEPAVPAGIVGRTEEIATVRDLLSSRPACLTLCGEGGVGKTTLARAVAAVTGSSVRWVDLDTATDAAEVAAAVGPSGGDDPLVAAAQLLVADRPSLVVLDNCEHVRVHARALVHALHGRVPVVATSRVPLGADGEQIVRVEPFALPSERPSESPAVQLLWAQLGGPTNDPPDQVRALLELLGGNALAIVLAAPLLRVSSALELRQRLEREGLALTAEEPGLPTRRRSVERSMDLTWNLLDDRVRRAALQSTVFQAPFSSEAAENVLRTPDGGSTIALLGTLMQHGLLRHREVPGARLLVVPPLVREYLARHGTPDPATVLRHAEWHSVRWDGDAVRVAGMRSATRLPFANHWPDLQAASRYWVDEGDRDRAAILLAVASISRLYAGGIVFADVGWATFDDRGLGPEAQLVVAWARDRTHPYDPELLPRLQAAEAVAVAIGDRGWVCRIRRALFQYARHCGHRDAVSELARKLQDEPCTDPYTRARVNHALLEYHDALGELSEARERIAAILEHAGPDDLAVRAVAWERLAWICAESDPDRAHRAAQRALTLDPDGVHPSLRAKLTALLAVLVRDRDPARALMMLRQAAEDMALQGNPQGGWGIEASIAAIELEGGEIELGLALARRIAEEARGSANAHLGLWTGGVVGAGERLLGNDTEADRHDREVEAGLGEDGPSLLAQLWLEQARIYVANGHFAAARTALDRFEARVETLGAAMFQTSRDVARRLRARLQP